MPNRRSDLDEIAGGFDLDVVMRAAFREKYAMELPAEVDPNLLFDPAAARVRLDQLGQKLATTSTHSVQRALHGGGGY
jgi:hypothetical protein